MCILPTEPVHMHLYRGGTRLLGFGWAKKKKKGEKMFFRVFKKKKKTKIWESLKILGSYNSLSLHLGPPLLIWCASRLGGFELK
jgi:hypothetical protein